VRGEIENLYMLNEHVEEECINTYIQQSKRIETEQLVLEHTFFVFNVVKGETLLQDETNERCEDECHAGRSEVPYIQDFNEKGEEE
jgi:hypothetical protein